MTQTQTSPRRGFTLIELMVVIAIIGVLATTVLAAVQDTRVKARDARNLQEARQLAIAIELYRNQNGGYPCSGNAGMNCLPTVNNGAQLAFLKRGSSNPTYNAAEDTLRTQLNFQPAPSGIGTGGGGVTLVYQVRHSGVPTNRADRSAYTILVGSEDPSKYTLTSQSSLISYCKISKGTPDTVSVMGTTNFSSIVNCPTNQD